MYKDLNGKFENLNIHICVLETQVARNAALVKAPLGTLSRKSEVNSKEYVQAIMLRSGNKVTLNRSPLRSIDPP